MSLTSITLTRILCWKLPLLSNPLFTFELSSEFENMEEKTRKWRLILGQKAEQEGEKEALEQEVQGMDNVLEALYGGEREGGLGSSSPNVNRWLGDIRKFFPSSIVQVMQKDAMERIGLEKMLLEPEMLAAVQPDINLVATLLSLNKVLPQKTRKTAREVVKKVVDELEKKLRAPLRQAIEGSVSRAVKNRRPKYNEIDWNKTIRANLKHYQKELNTIIPEHLIGHGKKGKALRNIILLIDQSASMSTSMVYSSVFGAVMASLNSVKTHLVVFDTSVVDLTAELKDPVELLFASQLGGGTDINRALKYTEGLITNPSETILVLISDLYEGGNERELIKRVSALKKSGTQFITLLALGDDGAPAYDKDVATKFASLGIPSFACTPDQFPELMATAIKKESIRNWMAANGIRPK